MLWVGGDRVLEEQKGCGEERRFVGRRGLRGRTLLKEFIIIASEWVHHTWTEAVSITFTGKFDLSFSGGTGQDIRVLALSSSYTFLLMR